MYSHSSRESYNQSSWGLYLIPLSARGMFRPIMKYLYTNPGPGSIVQNVTRGIKSSSYAAFLYVLPVKHDFPKQLTIVFQLVAQNHAYMQKCASAFDRVKYLISPGEKV